MKNISPLLTIIAAGLILFTTGCKKDDFENAKTLRKLYKTYENGMISECTYNGDLVYSAGANAFDAGGAIYDTDGKQIGSCNYAWGQPDKICGELEGCNTIYRVDNNIWGQPAVDKYGLGN